MCKRACEVAAHPLTHRAPATGRPEGHGRTDRSQVCQCLGRPGIIQNLEPALVKAMQQPMQQPMFRVYKQVHSEVSALLSEPALEREREKTAARRWRCSESHRGRRRRLAGRARRRQQIAALEPLEQRVGRWHTRSAQAR